MTDTVNEHEMRVVALKRSGHHAIIQWVYANVGGGSLFLNQCRPGVNPFDLKHIAKKPGRRFVSNIEGITPEQSCAGQHVPKSALIYNYEHHCLEEIAAPIPDPIRQKWVGVSARQTDILALRDPFNNLASLLKVYYSGTKYSVRLLHRSVELWKQYAHEALGHTDFLAHRLTINYNRWFVDETYKIELARRLELSGAEAGQQEVAKWGSTSSFDGTRLDGQAAQMKVLERWQHFADDPFYLRLVRDEELWELCEMIHGLPAGVERLRSQNYIVVPEMPATAWVPSLLLGKGRQLRNRWKQWREVTAADPSATD